MSLKDINIKKTYSSENDDILHDFYIPTLQNSIEYNRLTSYFSSKSIALSALGIIGLIKNKGIMKLIMSTKLEKDDYEILSKNMNELEEFIGNKINNEINEMKNDFIKSHIFALGWMLKNNKIQIKIAITKSGIFHQKVGILKDSNNNFVSFSGSVNETIGGWLSNIEEFKVFNNWDYGQKEYLLDDIKKFDDYWNNKINEIIVINLPIAIKKKLIEISPIDIDSISFTNIYKTIKKDFIKSYELKPFEYQIDAINEWEKNKYKGILEMATGTGKTFTSLFALKKYLNDNNGIYLIVICCPYQHLVDQWEESINNVFINIELIKCYDSKHKWYDKLNEMLQSLIFNKKSLGFVITTTATGSDDLFLTLINTPKVNKIVICDEVHNIGSENNQNFLKINSIAKLGLSATPIRNYDEEGNKKINDYFGSSIYILDIKKAIDMNFLVPYNYFIYFCELDDEEYSRYKIISKKIAQLYNKNNLDEEKLSKLLIERARISSSANNKIDILNNILSELKDFNNLLVFTAENPIFFNKTLNILIDNGLSVLKITSDINKNERLGIIKKHEDKDINCILSMRCVDEGVDIPSADKAIILSSSTNYKQYVQRRGRVLRKDKKGLKKSADIYDILVIPPSFEDDCDKKIFERELKRIIEFASSSTNYFQIINNLYNFSKENKILKNFANILQEKINESGKY